MGILSTVIGVANPVAGIATAALGKVKSVASSIPWQVWLAGTILLLAAVGGCVHTHKVKAFGDDRYRAGVASMLPKLQMTQASLDGALAQINDNNRRLDEDAAKLQQTREQAAADLARADARWASSKSQVSALEASARRTDLPACTVSDEARKALEGL